MLAESQYWKDDLKKSVFFLHEKLDQRVWKQSSFAAVEKRIMLSCYIAMKLAESNKIVPALYSEKVSLYAYKNRGEVVDLMNNHRVEELYEVDKAHKITKPFSYIANQIIHSYIFLFVFKSKNELEGVIFNSDKSKNTVLYMITIKDFIEVLSPIAQCYISKAMMERNENGEMVLVHAE